MSLERFITNIARSHSDEDHAYEMGFDCGTNGANETNCHFSIFSSRENTGAWERGKRDAEAKK